MKYYQHVKILYQTNHEDENLTVIFILFQVKGFPTLNIYKDGKKITEYSGKRGLEELEAFVKEHSETKKDEL